MDVGPLGFHYSSMGNVGDFGGRSETIAYRLQIGVTNIPLNVLQKNPIGEKKLPKIFDFLLKILKLFLWCCLVGKCLRLLLFRST